MYENKLEFPGGGGGGGTKQKKNFCGGSMDVFFNCTFDFVIREPQERIVLLASWCQSCVTVLFCFLILRPY